jgi:GNAT superfamily N-acetyltransferase
VERARPAEQADLVVVADLLTAALTGARTQRGGAALLGSYRADELVVRWTAGATSDTTAAVLYVGEFHHAVVGLAAATTFTRPGASALSGRIECCYVEEAARGVGVGTALMESVVTWCGERTCRDIDALALPGDRSSKQRLEAAGFVARLLTLNRRLD